MDPPENSGFGQVKPAKKGRQQDGWQENGNNDEQTLTFTQNQEEEMDNDLFT